MSEQKSITIITANYYPEDTAIGLYTTQFSQFLLEKGYKVQVLTGFPSYPQWEIYDNYKKLPAFFSENFNGIEIFRYKQFVPKKVNFKGRVLMMLDLFYGTLLNLKKIKNTDLVFCVVPFTTSILPAITLAKRKKAKLWVHIQDFEFDLALDSGVLKSNNLIFKLFRNAIAAFEKKMLNAADVTSSISFRMLEKIKEKSKNENPFYFPNWVSSTKINPAHSKQHSMIDPNKFSLLYSGNIGEKQDWDFLKSLCDLIKLEDNIEIIIVGAGGFKNELKAKIKPSEIIRYFEPVPYEDLNDLLCSANAHFLFQKKEVVDTIMPSKILGMMASQKPSLISGNKNSEVATIINQSCGGFYFSENDASSVYNKILELKNNVALSNQLGANARSYIINKFSEHQVLQSFEQKLKTVLDEK